METNNIKTKSNLKQNRSRIFIILVVFAIIGFSSLLFYSDLSSTNLNHTEIKTLLANVKQLDGTMLHQLNLDSKNYVIIHYWASWCAPCQFEMPKIFSIYKNLNEKYKIILVSEDENSNTALHFLKSIGNIPSPDITLWDADKKLSKKYGVFKLPETFIYDSKFNLIRKISGSMDWEDKKNLDFLNNL